jgi:hypothetical protein
MVSIIEDKKYNSIVNPTQPNPTQPKLSHSLHRVLVSQIRRERGHGSRRGLCMGVDIVRQSVSLRPSVLGVQPGLIGGIVGIRGDGERGQVVAHGDSAVEAEDVLALF